MESVIDAEYARFDRHSIFLTHNGDVYARGLNTFGELGLGDKNPRTCIAGHIMPEKISTLSNIASFYITLQNTFFITENGTIFAAGQNNHGQAGVGSTQDIVIPTPIDPFSHVRVARIEGNGSETYFLDELGHVYFCGRFNMSAWWGTDTLRPQMLKELSAVTKIYSQVDFTLFLNESGQVFVRRNNLTTAYGGKEGMTIELLPISNIKDIQCINLAVKLRAPLLLKHDGSLWTYDFESKQCQQYAFEPVNRMVTFAHHDDIHVFELMDGSYDIILNNSLTQGKKDETYGIDSTSELKPILSHGAGDRVRLTEPTDIEPFKQLIDNYEKKRKPISLLNVPKNASYCTII